MVTEIDTTTALTAQQLDAVDDLVRAATTADGVAPLNEESELRLHDRSATDIVHVRATDDDVLIGYVIAELPATAEPIVLECVVHPEHRRRGQGTALVSAMLKRTGEREVRAWAHGDLPGAAALAEALGFERARVLLKLHTQLTTELSVQVPPDGVTVRAFRPGTDDAAWLDLNARAFADHPEQGSMTQHDLDLRKAADWFDPAGFFLAERAGRLVGFHWTKTEIVGGEPIGEVYVVGIDPAAQGLGLGSLLTRHGLVHLRERGVRTVELYVDGDNDPALKVYRRLGFTEAARDVMYAQ